MRMRGWRSIAAVAVLGFVGVAGTTSYPARAMVFVQEFERTSKGGSNVGIWERVVYSLIEAGNRGADCRAPRTS